MAAAAPTPASGNGEPANGEPANTEPDAFPVEEIQLDGQSGLPADLEPGPLALPDELVPPEQAPAPAVPAEPLLSLKEAVERVPAELRRQMQDLLRAEFREVQRWKGDQ